MTAFQTIDFAFFARAHLEKLIRQLCRLFSLLLATSSKLLNETRTDLSIAHTLTLDKRLMYLRILIVKYAENGRARWGIQ
jgi:hypothetical protein